MKTRDPRLANLKPFQKGRSGNPKGRPKKHPISERYAAVAELPIDEKSRKRLKLPKGATWGDAVALVQFRVAAGLSLRGLTRAVREIREAIEGKATARIEISGPEGGEVEHKIKLPEFLDFMRDIYGVKKPDAQSPSAEPEAKKPDPALPLPGKVV